MNRRIAILIETDEPDKVVNIVLMADSNAERLRTRMAETRPDVRVAITVVGVTPDDRIVRD